YWRWSRGRRIDRRTGRRGQGRCPWCDRRRWRRRRRGGPHPQKKQQPAPRNPPDLQNQTGSRSKVKRCRDAAKMFAQRRAAVELLVLRRTYFYGFLWKIFIFPSKISSSRTPSTKPRFHQRLSSG